MLNNKRWPRLKPLAIAAPAVAVLLFGACTNDVELDPENPTTADGDSPAESTTSDPVGDATSSTSDTINDDGENSNDTGPRSRQHHLS